MMKVLDVRWFCGASNIAVVRVETEYEGIKYFIGTFTYQDEEQSKQHIAENGSTFPTNVGDLLFGIVNKC